MTNITINQNWYNEIKDRVPTANPYFYTDPVCGKMVEVDVDEPIFERVSCELGWMV